MKRSVGISIILAAGLLSACGGGESEGGLTREENEGLNEAANMVETLDVSPDSMTVSEDTDVGNTDDASGNGVAADDAAKASGNAQ